MRPAPNTATAALTGQTARQTILTHAAIDAGRAGLHRPAPPCPAMSRSRPALTRRAGSPPGRSSRRPVRHSHRWLLSKPPAQKNPGSCHAAPIQAAPPIQRHRSGSPVPSLLVSGLDMARMYWIFGDSNIAIKLARLNHTVMHQV
ncbi:Hypothetical protein bglu_2g06320 [Burkholderia glumae BGR1]|nr:Hypothetical protein bglu_2g06320 [Burkholderia glumae BGR1]